MFYFFFFCHVFLNYEVLYKHKVALMPYKRNTKIDAEWIKNALCSLYKSSKQL